MMSFRVSNVVLSLLVVGLLVGSGSVAQAQPGRGGGGGFRGGDFMNNPMMLLGNEQVREALEIVDDQVQQIDEISEEMRSSMRDMFMNFRDLSDEERQKKMTELNDEYQAKIDEVLLPHQQKRLKQIMMQQRGRGRSGLAGALSDDGLAKELNITASQKEEMQRVAEEARREMEEKVAQLRKEMEDKILGVLDAEQRDKYRELVGEPFELDMRQMFQGGRGRGGDGERGGDRGGDRGGRGRGGDRNDF
jgi:Spy/CpxP family protein refolding chaperone